jgi:hypothetical protein
MHDLYDVLVVSDTQSTHHHDNDGVIDLPRLIFRALLPIFVMHFDLDIQSSCF